MNIRRVSFFFLPDGKTFRKNIRKRKKEMEKTGKIKKNTCGIYEKIINMHMCIPENSDIIDYYLEKRGHIV
jgi:hypothetical protein